MLNLSPLNLLITVGNLLVLLVLMRKFLYKPVLEIIAKRQELIDGQFAQADAEKKEAEQLKKQYEACLAEAEDRKAAAVIEAKNRARIEYDNMISEAEKKAGAILAEAKKAGQEEKDRALREAGGEITKLAVAAAAKIVADQAGEESDHRIYDEFLKKAGEMSETDSR